MRLAMVPSMRQAAAQTNGVNVNEKHRDIIDNAREYVQPTCEAVEYTEYGDVDGCSNPATICMHSGQFLCSMHAAEAIIECGEE